MPLGTLSRLSIGLLCFGSSYAQGVQYGVNASGLNVLTYNGTDWYQLLARYDIYERWTISGVEGAEQFSNCGSGVTGSNPTSITLTCGGAGHASSWTFKAEYRGAGTDTLQIDFYLTNNHATELLRPRWRPLEFKLPDTANSFSSSVKWIATDDAYAGFINRSTGANAWWFTPANSNVQTNVVRQSAGPPETFYLANGLSVGTGQPPAISYTDKIAASGGVYHWVLFFRWGATGGYDLTPESFTNYASAFPSLTKPHADRRPVGRYFMSSFSSPERSYNPRNYNSITPNLDVLGNPTQFRSEVLAMADSAITAYASISPKPQAIIVWDIEGQEMYHAASYIGDPRLLPVMAPEMDVIADEVFAKFRNAGYELGITIRPTTMPYGTTLPETCTTAAEATNRDTFYKIDATLFYRGYECSSTDSWTQMGSRAPGHQTNTKTYAELLSAHLDKIAYAKARWGIKWFYVDSNVTNPLVYRDIMSAHPEVILLPENYNSVMWGATSMYEGSQPTPRFFATPDAARRVWGDRAFSYIVGPLASRLPEIAAGLQKGDGVMVDCWFVYSACTNTTAVYNTAALASSVVTVTDSSTGRDRSFSARPREAYRYPLILRLYFASSQVGLEASTTYCENKGTESCTLDLTGMTHYESRYYDWTGKLVSRGLSTNLN